MGAEAWRSAWKDLLQGLCSSRVIVNVNRRSMWMGTLTRRRAGAAQCPVSVPQDSMLQREAEDFAKGSVKKPVRRNLCSTQKEGRLMHASMYCLVPE